MQENPILSTLTEAVEFFVMMLGISLLFGLLFIMLLPHYVLITSALRKAWGLAIDPQTRIVPRSRWWFFGEGLRRYAMTWNLGLVTVGYIVGGCYLLVLGVSRNSSIDEMGIEARIADFLAKAFVTFVITGTLTSLLAVATSAFLWLLPRFKNHIITAISGAIFSMFFHGALTMAYSLGFKGIPGFEKLLDRSPLLTGIAVTATFAAPLAGCALMWRRWVLQGDAWFRIREE